MEHTGPTNGFAECCSQPGTVGAHEHNAADFTEQSCPIELTCDQALTNKLSEAPINLSGPKQLVAIIIASTILPATFKQYARHHLFSEPPVSFSPPPIFLLNSTFLN